MTIVLTCGPAWEPVDAMRRLTNASSGRLGSELGNALAAAGHRVVLFRGEGSTVPPPRRVAALEPFSTNDDLAARLEAWGRRERVDAVLHAAALCDFRVARVWGPEGRELDEGKISSRAGTVRIDLEPATKVLPQLRGWFPGARIVGWKYEVDGGREGALAAVARQFGEAAVDACVLNGPAWGDGFALCTSATRVSPCDDGAALAGELLRWLEPGGGLAAGGGTGFLEKRVPWEGLSAWRDRERAAGRRVVVTNGCFDLLHMGHASYLEAARGLGDVLLVGVNSDASVRRLKGPTRPVNSEDDRAGLLAALGCVDAVCVFDETSAQRFLSVARPDVWAKGADYSLGTLNQDERRTVEESGGRIAFLPLVAGRSTSETLRRLGAT